MMPGFLQLKEDLTEEQEAAAWSVVIEAMKKQEEEWFRAHPEVRPWWWRW